MKKFEEELNNGLVSIGQNIITKEYAYGKCALINYFKDWISPDDHQKVVEDLTNARSSITNLMAQLDYYKKDKRFEAMAEEILSLKSQLEKQQPEIPEFVAEVFGNNDVFLTAEKMDIISWFNDRNSDRAWDKVTLWARENEEQFIQYVLNFKPVAKEKRYEVVFLEDDTTRQILMENHAGHHFIEEEDENYGYWKQNFTEKEIKAVNEKFWHLSVPVKNEQIEVEE